MVQGAMRHLAWFVFAALLVLVGCGDSGSTSSGSSSGEGGGDSLTVGIVFDTGGLGDKSFNDSAWRGIQNAEKELGITAITAESQSENDYADNLASMADQGADLVIAVGINMLSAVQQVAPNYPDTKFALVDAVADEPNVRSLLFSEHQGSFLAGAVAGLMTKTGKVGFIGGEEIPLIEKFEAGYVAGVKAANPDAEVLPAKYTYDWNNVDKAKVAAEQLYGSGADIIYHAAGRAGLGMIRAAGEQNKYAIGVDSDQDYLEPGNVLTSMIKRVDEAVFQTIKDLNDGNFTAEQKVYDLASGGVGLSEMTHTKDIIGAENLKKIEEFREKIISGEINVPESMSAIPADEG